MNIVNKNHDSSLYVFNNLIILLFMSILFSGCLAMKVLTSSLDLLDTQNFLSIKPGMTRGEVIKIIGKPQTRERNEYDAYLYLDLHAQKDNLNMQEAHIYYDDNNVVEKTTFVNFYKGGNKHDAAELLSYFTDLTVGKSTTDQVKDIVYPTAYSEIYLNGTLQNKMLHYSTDNFMYEPLKELPYVFTTNHDDGTVSYLLLFSGKDILTTTEMESMEYLQ